MRKICEIGGFKVWYVNGYWIRNHLDPEFSNYDSSIHFNFIPKDEFWIDMESGKSESKYYIENFLAIQREMQKGKSYAHAWKIANEVEKKERAKSKFYSNLKRSKIKEEILRRVRKKQLFKKYTHKLKIYQVRGEVVRYMFFIDFTQGGHDKVYDFVPENEVWVDDDVYKKELPYVLIHELHERKLMAQGWKYDSGGIGIFTRSKDSKGKSAHFDAEKIEMWTRKHPKSIKRVLFKEIKDNEDLIKKEK